MDAIAFETHPSRYRHWTLKVEGELARLVLHTETEAAHSKGYELKLNSYDLAVDIELADAIQRLRFEHPKVKACVIAADIDRTFCSGANIYMLGASGHPFKVNFCKFTNETRMYMEEASAHAGLKWIAACKGTTAGGGYELALACDEIALVDDGSSAVSFPETPLLAVLPGTGGLTRLVDKRKVRRDRADFFCTLAEGIKGKRALEWGLVDALHSKSKFDDAVLARAVDLAQSTEITRGPAIELLPVSPTIDGDTARYQFVQVAIERAARTATVTISAPEQAPPTDPAEMVAQGSELWALRAFRELDDALLRLRFCEPDIGMLLLKTRGEAEHVLAADRALEAAANHGFAREVRLHQARVLRRLDLMARSLFAIADAPDSCFAGSLLELALAADRFYMLEDDDGAVGVHTSPANAGALPTYCHQSRLASRWLGDPAGADRALARGAEGMIRSPEAEEHGIATVALDDIDFEDELRIAIEERTSLSPDALTGMEASLRFPGPETMETKIFGRLSAWQNWIFTRPNATGERGALTLYGRPERPSFDFKRT